MSQQTSTSVFDLATEALGDADQFTPYKVATTVNSIFASLGIEKEIPTMMAYNYCKNNLIKGVTKTTVATKKGTREAVQVSREGALEWITKYVSKNLPK